MKAGYIFGGIILAFILIFIFWGIGVNNTAISMEENITEAKIAIRNAEEARDIKISGLVQGIRDYNSYEKDTVQKILDAISAAKSSGDVNEVNTQINALFAIPEIKSIDLYKGYAQEVSISSNSVLNYQEDYNGKVRKYNTHLRKFPNTLYLSIGGYEKVEYTYYQTEDIVKLDLNNIFG